MTTTEAETAGLTRNSVRALSLSKGEPDWMLDRRLAAFDTFETLPMPSRTDEDWRRTDIRRLQLNDLTTNPSATGSKPPSPLGLAGGYGGSVIQENADTVESGLEGHLRDQGVVLSSLEEAVKTHPEIVRERFMRSVAPDAGKFAALNGAFWSGGVFVYVPRNVDVGLPLRSLYRLAESGSLAASRTLIILEEGARLTYIEEYSSPSSLSDAALSAGVVEVFVGQEAKLTLVSLQEYLGGVFDINSQRALLARDSVLDWLVIGLGDGLTKSDIDVALQGPGARTQMLGILWGYGKQHTDYHTLQDHQAPNCTSDLLYKGALTDQAQSVFSGRIRVAKGAHRTDSYQANRTVILSQEASAFPSPNLEIEANDVRCTHGASVGKVDADQLFYLMSRGLPLDLATKMIVEGFFEEVLQREPAGVVRDNLRDLIIRKMEEREPAAAAS